MKSSDEMPELVYSPVLNFIQSNLLSGIEEDIIKRHGMEFFDVNIVKEAKSLLWQISAPELDCPVRKGNNALSNHFSDIISLLRSLDSSDTFAPTFVIKRPTEVPCLPANAYTSLLSKFNELQQVVVEMSGKLDNYQLNFPQLPKPSPVINTYTTVIVSKVPSDLSDPIKRKSVLDQIAGHELVCSVKPVKDRWYVNIDKSATEDFCTSVQNFITGATVKVRSKRFFGILRGFPVDVDLSVIKRLQGIISANRLGQTMSVKLEFEDSFTQSAYFKEGIKVGYEFFRIHVFKEIPKCCFKCRSYDHFQSACTSNVPKCARCAGPHISTKDSPCSAAPKCANCGKNHTSYSLSCPISKELMSRSHFLQ